MTSLYASIIRTSDGDILTEVQAADNYIDNVTRIETSLPGRKVEEVHMCSIAEIQGEPTLAPRDMARRWILRHL